MTLSVLMLGARITCAEVDVNTNTANKATAELIQAAAVSSNPAAGKSADETDPKIKKIRDGYKPVYEASQTFSGWCLLIIAASTATIVSTSYFRPSRKHFRLIYLLFLPGWLFIALSIRHGIAISEDYISLGLVSGEFIPGITDQMDSAYASQLLFFELALGVFALWLITFLLFWIFDDTIKSGKK